MHFLGLVPDRLLQPDVDEIFREASGDQQAPARAARPSRAGSPTTASGPAMPAQPHRSAVRLSFPAFLSALQLAADRTGLSVSEITSLRLATANTASTPLGTQIPLAPLTATPDANAAATAAAGSRLFTHMSPSALRAPGVWGCQFALAHVTAAPSSQARTAPGQAPGVFNPPSLTAVGGGGGGAVFDEEEQGTFTEGRDSSGNPGGAGAQDWAREVFDRFCAGRSAPRP
jgi:hypothetical protein